MSNNVLSIRIINYPVKEVALMACTGVRTRDRVDGIHWAMAAPLRERDKEAAAPILPQPDERKEQNLLGHFGGGIITTKRKGW